MLPEILRQGAQTLLATAIEAEVDAYLGQHAEQFDKQGHRLVIRIRDGIRPGVGDKKYARLSYPYAIEHDGKLYVIYSAGQHGGIENNAELANIPIESLAVHEENKS